jgi:oligopeptidase B
VPHEPGRLILSIMGFRDFLVRLERKDGLPRIVVRERATGDEHVVAFEEEAYSLGLAGSYEYDTDIIRFSYSSMTTPAQVYDYDMRTRERVLLKTQEVPSGHDPDAYVTRRLMATVGMMANWFRVSVLYRADTPLDGTAPCLLYGYGSYGIAIPASFNTNCCRWSIAASSMPSRMSVAARTRAMPGTTTASGSSKAEHLHDFIAARRHLVAEG